MNNGKADVQVSVIVPVYNREKYLHKCVESVLTQTYTDFELILVDDGSSDKSPKICDEYALSDNRVKVIHKENGGVSAARNTGIYAATGKYIMFIDSDDMIKPHMLSEMLRYDENTDIIISGLEWTDNRENVIRSGVPDTFALVTGEEFAERFLLELYDKLILFTQCAKLFKSSVIRQNNICFDEKLSVCEDALFVFGFLAHTKTLRVTEKAYYLYLQHEDDSLLKKRPNNFFDSNIALLRGIDAYMEKTKCIPENTRCRILNDCAEKCVRALVYHIRYIETSRRPQKLFEAMNNPLFMRFLREASTKSALFGFRKRCLINKRAGLFLLVNRIKGALWLKTIKASGNKRKKILIVTVGFGYGGVERSLINFLNLVDTDSYEIHIRTLSDLNGMIGELRQRERFEISSLRKLGLWTRCQENKKEGYLQNLLYIAVSKLHTLYTILQLSRGHFDWTVAYHQCAWWQTHRLRNSAQKMAIYHHGEYLPEVLRDKYVKCFDLFVAVSDGIKKDIEEQNPLYKDKFKVIHNIVPCADIKSKAVCEERLFSDEYLNIAVCGRLAHEKGFDIAIEACALLINKYKMKVRLYIIGDGAELDELCSLADRKGVKEAVFFMGFVSNPYPYMKQSDIYLQPSRAEAFGLTIAEAQVLGKAVVTTDTLGARELIVDGKTGIISDNTPEAFAAVIKELSTNTAKRKELEANAAAVDFDKQNEEIMESFYKIFEGQGE